MTLSILTDRCFTQQQGTFSNAKWTISNFTMPSGIVFFAITNDTDLGLRNVTSITHPNLSNVSLVGQRVTCQFSSNRSTIELWSGTGTSGSGNLEIQFNGTTYFYSLYTVSASSSVGPLVGYSGNANNSTSYITSISTTPTASNASYGIVLGANVSTYSGSDLLLSPWNDQTEQKIMGTYHRSRLSIKNSPDQNIGGQTLVMSISGGLSLGSACIAAYLFSHVSSSGGGSSSSTQTSCSMFFWNLW